MADISISRITPRGPNFFDVHIRIADFPRDFLAGSIDLSYSRCKKRPFLLRFLFFDFDCHPTPDESLSSGSFVFNPQEENPFAASPLAQFFFRQRITCKLTKGKVSDEDDDNCVTATYRLAVWAQAAANPTPIIDVEGHLEGEVLIAGGLQATAGGGTPPDYMVMIKVAVCCTEAADSPITDTPPANTDNAGPQPGPDEGMVKPLPDFGVSADCVIRTRVLSHPTQ